MDPQIRGVVAFALVTTALSCFLSIPASAGTYTETFSTSVYKDTVNTTAHWDTISGELKLHRHFPSLVGTYNTSGDAWGVAVAGDLAFVADGLSGLQIIDISDPITPTLAGTYNTSGYARDVAVSGDLAFVADDYSSGL